MVKDEASKGNKLKLFTKLPDAYLERRTSKMEFSAKIVNGSNSWTILAKSSILDVRLGSEYDADYFMDACIPWVISRSRSGFRTL